MRTGRYEGLIPVVGQQGVVDIGRLSDVGEGLDGSIGGLGMDPTPFVSPPSVFRFVQGGQVVVGNLEEHAVYDGRLVGCVGDIAFARSVLTSFMEAKGSAREKSGGEGPGGGHAVSEPFGEHVGAVGEVQHGNPEEGR